jgi:hypothetical protein
LEGPAGETALLAERRRRYEPGLLALARQNRARRDELFARLAEGWLEGRAAGFLGELESLESALAAAGG